MALYQRVSSLLTEQLTEIGMCRARARFSSRVMCSSSLFFDFLSRVWGRGVAPLPFNGPGCGIVYVWLWLINSWDASPLPLLRWRLRGKSREYEYFISDSIIDEGGLMTDEDEAAAPSKLFEATAYGSYGSYFNGTFGIDVRSVPMLECGCGCKAGGGKMADSWANRFPYIWCFFWATGWRFASNMRELLKR